MYDCTKIFRLEQNDTLTDPLKKIELFKAVASPAYIVASLEHFNEVSADFFCPVKKCFEFACEANFRKSTIPEYKREYDEIENRLVNFFGGWLGLSTHFIGKSHVTFTDKRS